MLGFFGLAPRFLEPPYAVLRGRPSFDALVREMASVWVERYSKREEPSQAELFTLGAAYRLRGEFELARRTLERAATMEGARSDDIQSQLRVLDARRGMRAR